MFKLFPIILLLMLSACDSNRDQRYTGWHFPYKPNMYQGNIIKTATLAKLQIGMDKSQVATLLGKSILSDDFNRNRWLYLQLDKINGGKLQIKKFSLLFVNEQLSEIKQ